jgi:hypothetical protein
MQHLVKIYELGSSIQNSQILKFIYINIQNIKHDLNYIN